MSLPSGLTFASGGVVLQAVAAASFPGGVGVGANGALVSNAGPPTLFPNGNPCAASGGLCAVTPGAGPFDFQNGFKYDSSGRIVTVDFSVAVAPLSSQNGFNFDANGALVTSPGGDPFWANVVALLNMEGADGSGSFVDQSVNAEVYTLTGSPTLSTATAPTGWTSAGDFESAGKKLKSSAARAYLNLGAGDFCVEAYVRMTSVAGFVYVLGLLNSADTNGQVVFCSQGAGIFGAFFFGAFPAPLQKSSVPANTWFHYALTYDFATTTVKAYYDGVSTGSLSLSAASSTNGFLFCGTDAVMGGGNTVRVAGLRITKGNKRYTADFTPPTGPLPAS